MPLVRQNHIPIGKETRNHLVISELKNIMLTADLITDLSLVALVFFTYLWQQTTVDVSDENKIKS